MAIISEQVSEKALSRFELLQKEFGVNCLSATSIQQLVELAPSYLDIIVYDAIFWYVNPNTDVLETQIPERRPDYLELIDFILSRQPELQNIRGVLEHVIGLAHKREYPYPVDAELVKSMFGEDSSVLKQTDELQIIKTKKKKKKKRSKH